MREPASFPQNSGFGWRVNGYPFYTATIRHGCSALSGSCSNMVENNTGKKFCKQCVVCCSLNYERNDKNIEVNVMMCF